MEEYMRLRYPLFLSGCLLITCACAKQMSSEREVVNTPERKEQILANLTQRHSALAPMKPTLGDFEQVSAGFDSVTMSFTTRRGPQTQTLFVTPDNKALYIIADGPIDASQSKAELEAAKEKEQNDRRAALDEAIKTMPLRGNPDAKVTIVEFSDFQCPYCKRGAAVIDEVIKKHGDKVRLAFAHFPLSFHPWAKPASIAAICAGNQNPDAFWAMHDAYFANQRKLTPKNIMSESKTYAASAKIDVSKWEACTKEGSSEYLAAAKTVDDLMELGKKYNVRGTPAFFVNGEFINGVAPLAKFESLIQTALGETPAQASDTASPAQASDTASPAQASDTASPAQASDTASLAQASDAASPATDTGPKSKAASPAMNPKPEK
jgi:protein-disulfide isomerase